MNIDEILDVIDELLEAGVQGIALSPAVCRSQAAAVWWMRIRCAT